MAGHRILDTACGLYWLTACGMVGVVESQCPTLNADVVSRVGHETLYTNPYYMQSASTVPQAVPVSLDLPTALKHVRKQTGLHIKSAARGGARPNNHLHIVWR